MRRFEEAGIAPDIRRGQNFLIDLNLLDLIIKAADLGPGDVVLEVGTGMGSLTARMAEVADEVVTVEVSAPVYQLASEELIDYPNVTMLFQDALKNKNQFAEEVLEQVRAKVAAVPGRKFKLCANLPYNIATPILSNLLTVEPLPYSMTATIQLELAERIVAPPSSKDYSALSVWMQAVSDVAIVRTMPPSVFWPRPRVVSAIVHIEPNAAKRARIADPTYFHNFVRGLFLHRRKFLRGVLVAQFKEKFDKPAIDAVLAEFGFESNVRAEELPVETLIRLADAFRRKEAA